jgi:hypothetical protein
MPTSSDDVRRIVADAVQPARFFVGPQTRLEWEHRDAEEVSWEVFRGRLLDPAHTRQRRTFESWNIYLLSDGGRSGEPLLSVKWDAAAGEIHVVRAVLSYAHEGYDAGGNVILTREVRKWVRELVGTIDLAEFASADDLLDEIVCRLFQAVVGTSRLPLTSVEAPLPAFTFGELGYCRVQAAGNEPMRSGRELLNQARPKGRREIVKVYELLLNVLAPEDLLSACDAARYLPGGITEHPDQMLSCLRFLFYEVSLSPYTGLVERALAFARWVSEHSPFGEDLIAFADFLAHLLRQVGRHLTAYDLVRFHHAGANYPDALLLDAVLREYLRVIGARPALFLDASPVGRLRRRALRQAWLIRRRYRGHLVPDVPTSPGENSRVLPVPHARVPEEQFFHPHRRNRQLFRDELPADLFGDAAQAVLRQSILDLPHPNELREMGMALYLDRPMGLWKARGDSDQTPMLAYEAFSRGIATQRLLALANDTDLLPDTELTALRGTLDALPVAGVPLAQVGAVERPGVVSLADAGKAAPDFVFLRTTESSALWGFYYLFQFPDLCQRFEMASLLGIPGVPKVPSLILGRLGADGDIALTVHETRSLRKRLELSADPRDGYACRGGVEYPRKGLRVRRVLADDGGEHDLTAEQLFVRPR